MNIGLSGKNGFLGNAISKQLNVIPFLKEPFLNERYFNLNYISNTNLNNIDIFIHCAAYLPKSFEDPHEAEKCMMNNGIATLQLLQEAEKANVKKFIYISSGTIYDPITKIASEDDPIYPSMRATYYLASKTVGDIFTDHFSKKSKMDIVIIRPSSIYGIGMKQVGLIPKLINKFKNNEIIDIINHDVDLVNVDDVAWMVAKAATDKNVVGKFNVGGGNPISTFSVANIIAVFLGKPLLENIPEIVISHSMLDISRAKSFGYNPINLQDGLNQYIKSL